jgi:hypothetical protein
MNVAVDTPPNNTEVAFENVVPVSVTSEPGAPLAGVNELTTGKLVMIKSVPLTPTPTLLLTLMGPLVAPAGTVARICVSESIVNVADSPLNATSLALVNALPVMVTSVPVKPPAGVNDVIVGGSSMMKSVALNPVAAALVTLIGPLLAPTGTVARICVPESTVKLPATVPLNET